MVLGVDLPNKENIYGFHENKKSQFLKITLALPRFIGAGNEIYFHTYYSCVRVERVPIISTLQLSS